MEARTYTPSDYPTLSEWWAAHKWPVIPAEFLSGTGLIVPGLCAGFIYKTDSAFAWLEFIVANPASDRIERSRALTVLIDALVERAKTMGFRAVHTSVQHPSLLAKYEASGFKPTDKGMTNMLRFF